VSPYSLSQFLGAFVAALIVRWNYTEALATFDPGNTQKSQGVFSTLPNTALGVSEWGAFRDQIIGTAILLFLILAVTDLLGTPPQANMAPFIIGLIVVAIGMAFGADAGYAINPARDFGPRLASFLTGYEDAFSDTTGYPYWWIPVVAPIIGGLIGAGLYQLLVGRFLPPADAITEPGRLPAPDDDRIAA
jgi:glycerol uptake facilitator protein